MIEDQLCDRLQNAVGVRAEVGSLMAMAKGAVDEAKGLIKGAIKTPGNADWCLKGVEDDYLAAID